MAGRPFLEWVVRYLAKTRRAPLRPVHRLPLGCDRGAFCGPSRRGMRGSRACARRPLGTAGGFLNACARRGDRQPALPGFSPTATPSRWPRRAPCWSPSARGGPDAAILGIQAADASRFGTLEAGPGGRLARFAEKRPGAGLINAGVYALGRGCIEMLPAKRPLSFETDCFPFLLGEGRDIRVVGQPGPVHRYRDRGLAAAGRPLHHGAFQLVLTARAELHLQPRQTPT